jgi:hypothetical protein
MSSKKKIGEKVVIFKLNSFNNNIPELTIKPSIKKSKGTHKKRDPKQDLETARMDAVE